MKGKDKTGKGKGRQHTKAWQEKGMEKEGKGRVMLGKVGYRLEWNGIGKIWEEKK